MTQWLFSESEFQHFLNSVKQSEEEDKASRRQWIEFMTDVGMRVQLPQPTIATAVVFFHRFQNMYFRYSEII
jgi:cyclin T